MSIVLTWYPPGGGQWSVTNKPGAEFRITNMRGLGPTEIEERTAKRIGYGGSRPMGVSVHSRVVEATIQLAPLDGDIDAVREDYIDAFTSIETPVGQDPEYGLLVYRREGRDAWQTRAIGRYRPVYRSRSVDEIDVQWSCPSPWWESPPRSLTLSPQPGGLFVPIKIPMKIPPTATARQATYQSRVTAPATLTFHGPLTSPTMLLGDISIQMDGDVEPGESVEVTTGPGASVTTIDPDGSRHTDYSRVEWASTDLARWVMGRGTRTITLLSDGDGSVDVKWRELVAGVV